MRFSFAFALVLVALLSYFALALFFGVYQRYPVVHILFSVIGVLFMVLQTKKAPSLRRVTATLCAIALLGVFSWWSLGYSTYGSHRDSALTSASNLDERPRIIVKTTEGDAFDFNAALKKSRFTLLVFNRGVW